MARSRAATVATLAREIRVDDLGHRTNPPLIFGGETPFHLPAHAVGQGTQRQEHGEQNPEKEAGAKAHCGVTRTVPSQSTVRGGAPFRTMAWALVSISGWMRAPPGKAADSRQGASDWRGSAITYALSEPFRSRVVRSAGSTAAARNPVPAPVSATMRSAKPRATSSPRRYTTRDEAGVDPEWPLAGQVFGLFHQNGGSAARASAFTASRARERRSAVGSDQVKRGRGGGLKQDIGAAPRECERGELRPSRHVVDKSGIAGDHQIGPAVERVAGVAVRLDAEVDERGGWPIRLNHKEVGIRWKSGWSTSYGERGIGEEV